MEKMEKMEKMNKMEKIDKKQKKGENGENAENGEKGDKFVKLQQPALRLLFARTSAADYPMMSIFTQLILFWSFGLLH